MPSVPFQSRLHPPQDPSLPPSWRQLCFRRSHGWACLAQVAPYAHLLVISLEELQEAGLGAGGTLHASEAQFIPDTLQVVEIHAQILNPETATFPNCGQLSRPEHNPKRTHRSLKLMTCFIKPLLLLLIITVTPGKGRIKMKTKQELKSLSKY